MSNQKLTLDLSDLAVESIEVVPATSMLSATYGHGRPELAASCTNGDGVGCGCGCGCGGCGGCTSHCYFMSEEPDDV